jgi:hypothetical protein
MTTLAAWSQVAASIAVLFTLVYLSIQVRQTAALIRAESRQAMMSNTLHEIFKVTDYPEIVMSFDPRTELTPEAKVRLDSWLTASLRAREHEWLQFKNGVLDKDSWDAYKQVIPTIIIGTKRTRQWWANFGPGQFHPEFCQLVESLLQSTECSDWATRVLEIE